MKNSPPARTKRSFGNEVFSKKRNEIYQIQIVSIQMNHGKSTLAVAQCARSGGDGRLFNACFKCINN